MFDQVWVFLKRTTVTDIDLFHENTSRSRQCSLRKISSASAFVIVNSTFQDNFHSHS